MEGLQFLFAVSLGSNRMFASIGLTLAISKSMLVGFSLFCGDAVILGDVDKRVRRVICRYWRVDLVSDLEHERCAATQKKKGTESERNVDTLRKIHQEYNAIY